MTSMQIALFIVVLILSIIFCTQVIPEEREAKDELNQDLWRDPRKANETVSTSGLSKRNLESERDGKL